MKRPFPISTVALTALVLLAYAAELAGGVVPFCLAHGFDPQHPTLASALASLVLHAGTAHLIGNVLVMVVVGAIVAAGS
jgi:membrane associated rhomboid family serine protease